MDLGGEPLHIHVSEVSPGERSQATPVIFSYRCSSQYFWIGTESGRHRRRQAGAENKHLCSHVCTSGQPFLIHGTAPLSAALRVQPRMNTVEERCLRSRSSIAQGSGDRKSTRMN